MKKIGSIALSLVLFTGISFASSQQNTQTPEKPKTEKKPAKKTEKKEVKKVPARKTVSNKTAPAKSGTVDNNSSNK